MVRTLSVDSLGATCVLSSLTESWITYPLSVRMTGYRWKTRFDGVLFRIMRYRLPKMCSPPPISVRWGTPFDKSSTPICNAAFYARTESWKSCVTGADARQVECLPSIRQCCLPVVLSTGLEC